MKKRILASALNFYLNWFEGADPDAAYYEVAMSIDLDSSLDTTKAQYDRYLSVLSEMTRQAESKF